MSDETPKPPPKRRKAAVAVRKPQRVRLRKVESDPVEAIHEAVHHVGKAVRACKVVYDIAAPLVKAMRRKK